MIVLFRVLNLRFAPPQIGNCTYITIATNAVIGAYVAGCSIVEEYGIGNKIALLQEVFDALQSLFLQPGVKALWPFWRGGGEECKRFNYLFARVEPLCYGAEEVVYVGAVGGV